MLSATSALIAETVATSGWVLALFAHVGEALDVLSHDLHAVLTATADLTAWPVDQISHGLRDVRGGVPCERPFGALA